MEIAKGWVFRGQMFLIGTVHPTLKILRAQHLRTTEKCSGRWVRKK